MYLYCILCNINTLLTFAVLGTIIDSNGVIWNKKRVYDECHYEADFRFFYK